MDQPKEKRNPNQNTTVPIQNHAWNIKDRKVLDPDHDPCLLRTLPNMWTNRKYGAHTP
jgi:hypothetical protein